MAKLTITLILLLLGCKEEQKNDQAEPPNLLDCAVSCDDEKIKAWYQKKYGEPITDFELSARKVSYKIWGGNGGGIGSYFRGLDITSVTKTATGASAYAETKAEFSMEEWLDFIRSISKLRIGEWEKEYRRDIPMPTDFIDQYNWVFNELNSSRWTVEIILSSDTLRSSGMSYAKPANFHYLEKILKDIEYKAEEKSLTAEERAERKQKAEKRKERESKLNALYQKKYGKPITDLELSIGNVFFRFQTDSSEDEIYVYMNKEEGNARASISSERGLRGWEDNEGGERTHYHLKLSVEDWLDFMHDLHEARFYEWEKNYPCKRTSFYFAWRLDIDFDVSYIGCSHPPNWAAFKKAMDDMAAKIKEKFSAQKKAADSNLATQYRKIFGEPITDSELSTTTLGFKLEEREANGAKTRNKIREIEVTRDVLETKAKASLKLEPHVLLYDKSAGESFKIELGIEDWLAFVRALHKSRFYEWEERYKGEKRDDSKWWDLFIGYNDKSIEYGGFNAYPENWAEFEKIMDDMEAKIKKGAGK